MNIDYNGLEIVRLAKRIEYITGFKCYVEDKQDDSVAEDTYFVLYHSKLELINADNKAHKIKNYYGLVLYNKKSLDRFYHMEKISQIVKIKPEISYESDNNWWITVWDGDIAKLFYIDMFDNMPIHFFYRGLNNE